jgi:hypothetical protein
MTTRPRHSRRVVVVGPSATIPIPTNQASVVHRVLHPNSEHTIPGQATTRVTWRENTRVLQTPEGGKGAWAQMQAGPAHVLVHWRNSEFELQVGAERKRGDGVVNAETSAHVVTSEKERPVAPETRRPPHTLGAAA